MQLNPHLTFDGQCEEAFSFYAQCFGGSVTAMMRYGDSPLAGTIAMGEDKIIHATLHLGRERLTGADVPSERYGKPEGFHVLVTLDDPDRAERIFALLAECGAVEMDLAETFWAQRYGMVTDRFGTPWMINCEKDR